MQHIPIQEIICEDVELSQEIQDLSESIRDRGLLHPITVQSLNGKYKVIAGRKRLKACTLIGVTEIPCHIIEGDENKILLTQLEENLRRENLAWHEINSLVSRWHAAKQEELGKSAPIKGKANREKPGWSMRDTAAELGRSLGFISEAVLLDNAVKRNPSLRNIKDRDTALRLVRAETARRESEEDSQRPVSFAVDQVFNGSSVDILKQFPPGSFDACITDPPWLKYIDAKLIRDDETVPVFKEVYRVLRPDSFLYLFVGFEDYHSYSKRLPGFGFEVSKTPLIWIKRSIREGKLFGTVFSKGAKSWEYSRDFELILLAVKGSPALTERTSQSSVFLHPPLAPVTLSHPHEKPVALIQELLDDCSYDGSIILDPFAGSGAHLEAAKKSGRRWVGIEREHEYYVKIVERMKK